MPLLKVKNSIKNMETNINFSINRLMQICRQSLIINRKLIGITVSGFSGLVFLILILSQIKSYTNWSNNNYMLAFTILFFSTGIIYSSLSFPAFRMKEKTISYLLLPAATSEKFTFEVVTRIVIFLVVMPFLFWLMANIEGIVMHYYKPEFLSYKFSLITGLQSFTREGNVKGWTTLAIIQGVLFVFITSFTGASYFSKSPLVKTLFSVSIIMGSYALFTYLLIKGLKLEEYTITSDRLLFIHNEKDAMIFSSLAITTVNICLLAISYFRLKEREV